MSYCTATDLLKRYDARIIGDLIGDNNARVEAASIVSDPNVQAALDDASGMINSAILVAQKYTSLQLAALTGADQAFLVRLVCNLAFGLLTIRRGLPKDKLEQYEEALETLKMLRSGERVFAVPENEAAGNPSASFPSASVYSNLDLMRDYSKYFPTRRDQRVTGP